MPGFFFLFGLFLLLVLLGVLEYLQHRKKRDSIPIRIHVNGTRGKSSVTRLIAAGLRAGGFRVYAKITGTLPRLILPDGREKNILRFGFPNILEQKHMIFESESAGADAIVLECMALLPFNQWISEEKFIRATHLVITNVREDHLETMGPLKKNVALALAGSIPENGILFTSEKEYLSLFESICQKRNSEIVTVSGEKYSGSDYMQGFEYYEYPENVALALSVCESLGIDSNTALEGMWSAAPDLGASSSHTMSLGNKTFRFMNGFAANDPESARQTWERANDLFSDSHFKIALVNCRKDRQERSEQMGAEIASWKQIRPDLILCVGENTRTFLKSFLKQGNSSIQLIDADGKNEKEITELLESLIVVSDSYIVGLGNIAGLGLQLTEMFRRKEKERKSDLKWIS